MPPRPAAHRLNVLTLARDAGSGYGGAEKVAYEFARRLDPDRFHSWLCTTSMPVPSRIESVRADRLELQAQGIGVLALDRRTRADLGAWLRLLALLRRERIDIVHAHMPRASVPGAILARVARVPVVISHEHGSVLDGKIVRPLLDRMVVGQLSTKILAVSEWDRRQLIEGEGIRGERIDVLPNGITAVSAVAAPLRQQLELGARDVLVGAVGRLYPEKGYDDLIAAMAELRDRAPEIVSVIVGDGPEESTLREAIRERGLDRTVRLLGRRRDVPAVLAALDIAVLPSKREGAPLAMIEYMAAAKPIVATAVGGIPEMIEHERHGLLVPGGDPAALAAALERLSRDPEAGRRLGEAARERQRERFDLDTIVNRLQEIYLEFHARARTNGGHR